MHSPLTHGEQHLLESSLNPPEKKLRNQLPVLTDLWVRLLPLQKEKSTFFSARKDYRRIHEKQPVMQAFLIRLPCTAATYALINVSWLGEVHGMTNTLTDAAGVGNTAGQRTRSIAEVVLVYFPILVLISSTTRKLKRQSQTVIKKQLKMVILIIIWVIHSS